jgi:hypothetical protein
MFHTDNALQKKIDTFMSRKEHEYPELADL